MECIPLEPKTKGNYSKYSINKILSFKFKSIEILKCSGFSFRNLFMNKIRSKES